MLKSWSKVNGDSLHDDFRRFISLLKDLDEVEELRMLFEEEIRSRVLWKDLHFLILWKPRSRI